jgi:hypothetical protein
MNTEKFDGFFANWIKVCQKKNEQLLTTWDNKTEYTKTMLCGDDSVIGNLADELSDGQNDPYKYYPEYYSIDVVLYKEGDNIQPNPPHQTWGVRSGFWLKKIAVAIEHENNVYSAYQEICHLLTISADMKAVITYPPNIDDEEDRANDFQLIVKNLDKKSDPILLIFGYRQEQDIKWHGYLLKAGEDVPTKLQIE